MTRPSPPPRSALLVINTNSRSGRAALASARQALTQAGLQVTACTPEDPAACQRAIREHAGRVARVIIGGGDGTIRAALDAILATDLPLGVLPLGTANDLARTLGLPLDLPAAARIAAADHWRAIDVGRVNQTPFLNVAHIGLGTRVTRRLSTGIKGNWGIFSYAIAAMRAVRQAHRFEATITLDGQAHRQRTVQIGIGSGRFYGGGMQIFRRAAIDDGSFDLYSVRTAGAWQLMRLAPSIWAGRYAGPALFRARAQCIEIVTDRPRPVTADGEFVTDTPARFEMLPGALRVYVPPSGGPGLRPPSAQENDAMQRNQAMTNDALVALERAAEQLGQIAAAADDDALRREAGAAGERAEQLAATLTETLRAAYGPPRTADPERLSLDDAVLRLRGLLRGDQALAAAGLAALDEALAALEQARRCEHPAAVANGLSAAEQALRPHLHQLQDFRP